VRRIPQGKVTTYGHVAKLIGMPSYSRHVAQGNPHIPFNTSEANSDTSCNVTALSTSTPAADPPVPWQRVISSAGKISSRGPGTDGAQRQREALETEDVEVRVGRANELLVDFTDGIWVVPCSWDDMARYYVICVIAVSRTPGGQEERPRVVELMGAVRHRSGHPRVIQSKYFKLSACGLHG